MKLAVAVCTIAVLTCLLHGTEARRMLDRLYVLRGNLGNRTYVKLPTSIWDQRMKHWVKTEIADSFYYCRPPNLAVCLHFDDLGIISGLLISFPRHVYDHNFEKYAILPADPNALRLTLFGHKLWSVRVWFKNPEEHARNDTSEIVEDLWTELEGKMAKMADRCQPNSPTMGNFDLQGCNPGMGTFFIYNSGTFRTCRETHPAFVMYELGDLIGFGFGLAGEDTNDWYYHPDEEEIQKIMPDPSKCFKEFMAASNGNFMVATIFLVKQPWTIRCPECHG